MTDNEALKLAAKMHQEFNALSTKFDLEFTIEDEMWYRTDQEILWNTDGNKEDLFDGDGNTYGVEIRWIIHDDEDFLLAYVDNGCGDKYKLLLLKEKQVHEEDENN